MNILKEYPMIIDYENNRPDLDLFIKITIPKQKNWYDTKAIAKEVKKRYEHNLKEVIV